MIRFSILMFYLCAAPLLLAGFSPLLAADDAVDNAAQKLYFERQVTPILVGRCLECHGSEHKGELDLRSKSTAMQGGESGSVLEPGDAESSLLFDYVVNEQMPPKNPLTAEEIAVLKQWIDSGAYFPDKPLNPFDRSTDKRAGYDWWSLRPLGEVQPPTPDGIPATWNENPIDRFVFAKLVENQLQSSAPAERRELLRRITYDLIGMPPTPQELEDFLNDDSPDAYERVVDRLLASPHYGEQWGRHWLDVIRFGESRGFERNEIINNAWPFRDYVIRSFNDDKPYNQMVLEHLAGDVVGAGRPDVEIATAFLVGGPYDDVGNQDAAQAAQIRANTIDEIIRATSEAFLGLTVGCARCHNHKFDPVTQEDYYGLYATFAGVHHGPRVIATAEQKQQHAAALQPLQEKQQALEKQRGELDHEINMRGEERAAEFESGWTREPVQRTGAEETFPPVSAKFVRLTVEGVDTNPQARSGYGIEEFEAWTAGPDSQNVAAAKNGGKATGQSRTAQDFDAYGAMQAIDGRFGARWIAAGPELTVEFAAPQTIDRILFSSDRSGAAGSHSIATFVCEYRLSVSVDGEKWTEVATTADRKPVSTAHRRKRLMDAVITAEEQKQLAAFDQQLAEVRREQSQIAPLPVWWAGTFSSGGGPYHVFLGGSPQRPGHTVAPASLSTLNNVAQQYQLPGDSPESERRLSLANWLMADDNPLPARVMANRLWHYHFGTGIVATPSDFGFMGVPPTHPQLLDWLAGQLQQNGWHLKPLHKQIVMSHAYRQSTAYREDFAKVDTDSRYLWRFPPRRLAAEEIRDAMLLVADKLNRHPGGPGFRLYHYLQDNVATYVPLDDFGPETYRRSVYHQNARASRIDLMTDFDSPDCAFATPRRSSTTSPLQALTLMNHKFTLDMAAALTDRIRRELPESPSAAEQVGRAFELCYLRTPTDDETTACTALVEQHGLPALCRVLLNSNEFIYLN